MFLRAKIRRKDGKDHRTWSIVENRRSSGGGVVQRHVLYLGEINVQRALVRGSSAACPGSVDYRDDRTLQVEAWKSPR